MDPEFVQKAKKYVPWSKVHKDLVDPYCVVHFAGIEDRTATIEHENDPEWNEQLNLSVKASSGARIGVDVVHLKMAGCVTAVDYFCLQFPSMCERIRFQVMDWYVLNGISSCLI